MLCPSEPKYDDCYCFAQVDTFFITKITLNVNRMTEPLLLMKTIHLLQRYLWGRGSEIRSLNRNFITLLTGASAKPVLVTSFLQADRMTLSLRGTKRGKGMSQTSPTITVHRIREKVVGSKAFQALDLFALLAELEKRYEAREVANREDKQNTTTYAKHQTKYGDGFFLSLKPERTSGKYYYLSPDTIRNYGKDALTRSGVPDKYKGHATRHAAESLLLDANVPIHQVVRQARHTKEMCSKTYRHPSDKDHADKARRLWSDVQGITPQELLACATTPASHFTMQQSAVPMTQRKRKAGSAINQTS